MRGSDPCRSRCVRLGGGRHLERGVLLEDDREEMTSRSWHCGVDEHGIAERSRHLLPNPEKCQKATNAASARRLDSAVVCRNLLQSILDARMLRTASEAKASRWASSSGRMRELWRSPCLRNCACNLVKTSCAGGHQHGRTGRACPLYGALGESDERNRSSGLPPDATTSTDAVADTSQGEAQGRR